ncbi:MAG: type III pantothenate kinase [Deltaproteobacteria bacterium]|nr:type III pantothenate kinase [Deltaproteobacteria bacterium]
MILVIDIGNSDCVFGIYHHQTLTYHWRIPSSPIPSEEKCLESLRGVLEKERLGINDIRGCCLSSVVESLTLIYQAIFVNILKKELLVVEPAHFSALKIRVDSPEEVGTDRLLNALAAFHLYRTALIVIDLGTATTMDVVSSKGEFLGGAIMTGLKTSMEALAAKASRLPPIELKAPERIIGKNTVESMQSGIIIGYAVMVDSMSLKIQEELGFRTKTIATGGLSSLISPLTANVDHYIGDLTLYGLYLIYQSQNR